MWFNPLIHGSGIGLWLAKWVVDDSGGDLVIKTPAEVGTLVRLRLRTV